MGLHLISSLQFDHRPHLASLVVEDIVQGNLSLLPYDSNGPVKTTSTEQKDETDANVTARKNPLSWFGILVPKCLRDAQQDFMDVVRIAMRATKLVQELDKTRREFVDMKEKMKKSRD
eukprot:Sdes_comp16891_c0_seq4m6109